MSLDLAGPGRPGGGRDTPADASRHVRSRAREMAAWRKRSARVKLVRRLLPWTMLGLAVLVVGWISVRTIVARIAAGAAELAVVHMVNPKYRGRDERGEPYLMTADSATRDPRNPYQVQLVEPRGTLVGKAPQPTTMRSVAGLYREDTDRLTLIGDAVLEDGTGYVFRSQRAVMDLKLGTAQGDEAVTGDGPMGHISASSYAITDRGHHVTFTGNVKSHILQGDGRGAR